MTDSDPGKSLCPRMHTNPHEWASAIQPFSLQPFILRLPDSYPFVCIRGPKLCGLGLVSVSWCLGSISDATGASRPQASVPSVASFKIGFRSRSSTAEHTKHAKTGGSSCCAFSHLSVASDSLTTDHADRTDAQAILQEGTEATQPRMPGRSLRVVAPLRETRVRQSTDAAGLNPFDTLIRSTGSG